MRKSRAVILVALCSVAWPPVSSLLAAIWPTRVGLPDRLSPLDSLPADWPDPARIRSEEDSAPYSIDKRSIHYQWSPWGITTYELRGSTPDRDPASWTVTEFTICGYPFEWLLVTDRTTSGASVPTVTTRNTILLWRGLLADIAFAALVCSALIVLVVPIRRMRADRRARLNRKPIVATVCATCGHALVPENYGTCPECGTPQGRTA